LFLFVCFDVCVCLFLLSSFFFPLSLSLSLSLSYSYALFFWASHLLSRFVIVPSNAESKRQSTVGHACMSVGLWMDRQRRERRGIKKGTM
jgi:hypothetical protein